MKSFESARIGYKARMWFRREMTGKSLVAQVIDALAMCAMVFFICYIWFLGSVQNQILALALSLMAVMMFLVALLAFSSIRLDSFIKKYTSELYGKALQEHMLLVPTARMRSLIIKGHSLKNISTVDDGIVSNSTFYTVIQQHPSELVTPSQVLSAFKTAQAQRCKSMSIYSTAHFNDEARSLAKQFNIVTTLHEPAELIALAQDANLLPPQEVIHNTMMEGIELRKQKRKEVRKGALVPTNVKRYLFCAAIMIAASFLTGYKVYYPIIAAVCVCLALLSWYFGRLSLSKKKEESENALANSAQISKS